MAATAILALPTARRHNALDHRRRRPDHLQPSEVEGHGAQGPGDAVDQMPRRHVVSVTAATNEHLRHAGPQIQHRDLRVVEAAGGRIDREEDRAASSQELGPEMIAVSALAIGLRDHSGLATSRRHALQACHCRGGREDNGPVRLPTWRHAKRRPLERS